MGQSLGKGVKRGYEYFSNKSAGDACTSDSGALQKCGYKYSTPLVLKRSSSLYFDEDGDLAHEFYQEVKVKNSRGGKFKLKKITHGLIKQGEVTLQLPRLHHDFPRVIY